MKRLLPVLQFILFLCLTNITLAQNTFRPLLENFYSSQEWENPNNWQKVSGNASHKYPQNDDHITFTEGGQYKITTLGIHLNLDDISTALTFENSRNNAHYIIGINGNATINFGTFNPKTQITVLGTLTSKTSLLLKGNKSTVTVSGNLIINEDFTLQNSNNLISIHKGGNLSVEGNFYAANGGGSTYSIDGTLTIKETLEINGKEQFTVLENGSLLVGKTLDSKSGGGAIFIIHGNLNVEGNYSINGNEKVTLIEGSNTVYGSNIISKNGGGGNFTIGGNMLVKETFDIFGGETIDLQKTGQLEVRGDIILSCNNSLKIQNQGNFIFNTNENSCIIRDAKCYESSKNYQLCEKINNSEDLPVELSYFVGQKAENGNLLIWKTLSEINCDYFSIEYSNDNKMWQFLDTLHGAGNINTPVNYEYLDTLSSGDYYRLLQFDFDNSSTVYGPVVFKNENDDLTIKTYPTVVKQGGLIRLEVRGTIDKSKLTIQLISSNAKIVKEVFITADIVDGYVASFKIPYSIENGIYILKVFHGYHQRINRVIIN
ncbi:hypothetical protein [Flammeovirga kamogawensis]|uniref:T9SS type A sorting domain-containing protein n=1 Tax=Flammeovirga kamogawensis TaxID=373891 RepID=A0ABX8GZM7_9BACT|nr:hypothetical protein [Flammeovirga kamogawensis]MBB6459289.1 hypothetical protein [Flammeovirga kamogawensis]QWG08849.1 hypothetical protein KM029_07880 [Flammeovirga kamogawensis]TRX67139.1 hypothetical protein EO216_02925 [Flammeovirga kamogawensis]